MLTSYSELVAQHNASLSMRCQHFGSTVAGFSLFLITPPFVVQEMLKNQVTKPYAPSADVSRLEGISKEGDCIWSPQQMPESVTQSSTFGNSSN